MAPVNHLNNNSFAELFCLIVRIECGTTKRDYTTMFVFV
jgi:hypothetical protein